MASLQSHMRIWLLVCSFVFMAAVADAETARYDIDPEHTIIGFSAVHMLVSNVQGQFKVFSGFIEMDPEAKKVNIAEAAIKAWSIDTKSSPTGRSPAQSGLSRRRQIPTLSYKLKSYRKTGNHETAVGDLTLHGVTKEVTLVGI